MQALRDVEGVADLRNISINRKLNQQFLSNKQGEIKALISLL
jgi:hypothetical protein